MKQVAYFLLIILLVSCNYFEKQKVNSEDLLKEELQTFNWNDVDTYPTFDSCNSISSKEESLFCFQNTVIEHVNAYLEMQNIVVSEDVNDTIRLQLIVSNKGVLQINDIAVQPETEFQIPEIDSLLRQSLSRIPKIYPAIKRGQQVTTAFELPILVMIE